MSQQINLLAREDQPMGAAWGALAVVAALVLGLLAYDAILRAETARLRSDVDSIQRALSQGKTALQAIQRRTDPNDEAAALKAEISALRLKAEAAKQWEGQISNGILGSPDGYVQYLGVLASLPEDGLWLTNVAISNAGKTVALSGRALHNESVLRYAKRLNEVFASHGVRFNSVEMTPENVAKTGDPGKPVLTTVAFKLF